MLDQDGPDRGDEVGLVGWGDVRGGGDEGGGEGVRVRECLVVGTAVAAEFEEDGAGGHFGVVVAL